MLEFLRKDVFCKIFKNNNYYISEMYQHINVRAIRLVVVADLQPVPKMFNNPEILVLFTAYFDDRDLWRPFVVMMILELQRLHLNLVFVFVGRYAESIRTENCIKDDRRFLMLCIERLDQLPIDQINRHLGMHAIAF